MAGGGTEVDTVKLTKYNLDASACGRTEWEVFFCDLKQLSEGGEDDVQRSILYHHLSLPMPENYKLMRCGQLISAVKFHGNVFDGDEVVGPSPECVTIRLSNGTCQAYRDGDYVLFVVAKS